MIAWRRASVGCSLAALALACLASASCSALVSFDGFGGGLAPGGSVAEAGGDATAQPAEDAADVDADARDVVRDVLPDEPEVSREAAASDAPREAMGSDASDACGDDACVLLCGALTKCFPDSGAAYCADLQNDSAHCGGCGNACSSGEVCSAGACGMALGGFITGLSPGNSIVLTDNGSNATMISANGTFRFAALFHPGTAYSVAAQLATGAPVPETCVVRNAVGALTASVASVDVSCVPQDVLYYFPFSGNANDASGNGNNGVVTGTATLTSDRFGNASSAYNFDGKTSYITAPGSLLPFGATSRTLTAWLEPRVAGENLWGILSWGSGNCTAHMFGIGGKNGDYATLWEGCNDYISPMLQILANQWSFVAAVYSSDAPTTYSLYVNDHSEVFQMSAPATGQGPLLIGKDPSFTTYFDGNVDSIRIYGRALIPSEIQSIFKSSEP